MMRTFLLILGLGFLIACSGGSGSGSGSAESTESSVESTGAAVAALFGTGESAGLNKTTIPQRILRIFIKEALAQAEGAGMRNTCDDPDGDGMSDGPHEIDTPLTGTPGAYGDTVTGGDHQVTVTEESFCQQSDGTENEGDDLFASYELTSNVTGTCSDDSTVTMVAGDNSTGIWRNTDDCFPEIFGNFEMGDGTIVSCHICLAEDQTVNADNTSCSSSGTAISLTSEVSCTLSTESGEEDTEDMGGDEPMGEDEEDF